MNENEINKTEMVFWYGGEHVEISGLLELVKDYLIEHGATYPVTSGGSTYQVPPEDRKEINDV